MKQADKSDKSHLTFGSSTSDDEKIIKVVDHGMKTAASHHANNGVRDRWGAKETERESVIRYPRNSCSGKNPVSRTSNENPVILFFFLWGGGTPGPNAKLPRYQQSSENSSEKKTTPRCQLSSCETNLM